MSTARKRGIDRALALTTSRAAALAATTVFVLAVATVVFAAFSQRNPVATETILYPIIWIGLSVFFVLSLHRRAPSVRTRPFAVVVAISYFLILAVVGGLLWPSHQLLGHHHHHTAGARLLWLPPGWGPTLLYSNSLVQISIVPFKLVGYAALAYGVGVAVAASSRGALAGIGGMFSCVGCLLPLLALATGTFGSAGTLVATVGGSYALGTAVFLLTLVVFLAVLPEEGHHTTE